MASARPRGREPGQGAFADQLPLELGQRREDAEHEAAGGAGGVDLCALPGEHPHAHAAGRQVLHSVDQVGGEAGDDGVANGTPGAGVDATRERCKLRGLCFERGGPMKPTLTVVGVAVLAAVVLPAAAGQDRDEALTNADILTLTPAGLRDFKNPGDAADGDTAYQVRVQAADPSTATPAITGLADTSVMENMAYTATAAVPGAPGSVMWTKAGADVADFTINATTGVLRMVARDFENPVDADRDNGYEVTVQATVTNTTTPAITETVTKPITVTVTDVLETETYDESLIAALRARITGGAVFFNGVPRLVKSTVVNNGVQTPTASFESAQFSQASYYLAFEVQPILATATWGDQRGYDRFYLEPFVNVRLTTIPVAGPAEMDAMVEGQEENGASGTSEDGSLLTPPPSNVLLQSQKAALLQFGAVGSFNFGKFDVGNTHFHWGGGPTFRFSFQSVTDAQRTLRVWNINDDLYDAWTFGGRLTLYGSRDNGRWMPSSYLDISWGKFQSFELPTGGLSKSTTECLENARKCLATGLPRQDLFKLEEKGRWYIEGRVFFQSLYVGFDINNGDGHDDLRFSAGWTLNLNQFLPRSASGY